MFQILLGESALEFVDKIKYLGITIDRHLNWHQQCKNTARNINNGIAAINRLKDGLPLKERIGLYHALVEPHLDYCAPVWGNGSEKVTKAIEVAQRKSVRALIDYSKKSTTKANHGRTEYPASQETVDGTRCRLVI